jgi:hypothetical protein
MSDEKYRNIFCSINQKDAESEEDLRETERMCDIVTDLIA